MKAVILLLTVLAFYLPASAGDSLTAPNLFIITIDGIRWQEVFLGLDEGIAATDAYTGDAVLLRQMYGGESRQESRSRLMPFLWNIIAKRGQIYGNRTYENHVNVANWYKFSYPGYNEMLTGNADPRLIPNTPVANENVNVLEFINSQPGYTGKVAAFTSWNIFPFILNEQRCNFYINSGYEALDRKDTVSEMIDSLQRFIRKKGHTRHDEITYLAAREYIKQEHPKVLLVSFGEADEYAHHGEYDNYIRSIANTDRMIGELWAMIQADPFYRNNTTFLITTDHGRGKKKTTWTDHLFLIRGSGAIWLAMMGPDILPFGEIKEKRNIYQRQFAQTMAGFLNLRFVSPHSDTGHAIDFNRQQ